MKNNIFLITILMIGIHISLFSQHANPTTIFNSGSTELTIQSDALPLSPQQAQKISNRLTQDPLKLLNELKHFKSQTDKYCQDIMNNQKPFESAQLQNYFEKDHTKNQICFLGECTTDWCGLSRQQNSSRSVYEKTVLDHLKKYQNQDKINLVSFASGAYFFQDAVILAKAAKNQITNINIHMIDPQLEKYITMKNHYDPHNQSSNLASKIYEYSIILETSPDIQKKCEMYFMVNHARYNQFTSLVKQLSDNKIKIYFHKDAATYQEFCLKNPHLKADLITGIDFEPDYIRTCWIDYTSLLYHTLKKGGTGIVIASGKPNQRFDTSQIQFITKKEECSKEFLEYVTKSLPILLSNNPTNKTPQEIEEFEQIANNLLNNNQYLTTSSQDYWRGTSTATWKKGAAVAVASLLTLGCYKIYKTLKTRNELNQSSHSAATI